MNKVIRDHYPVRALPDDLRDGLDPDTHVRVTIEEEPSSPASKIKLKELLKKSRSTPPIGDDPVSRIRKLRDEWED